jgi:hypothetical protein
VTDRSDRRLTAQQRTSRQTLTQARARLVAVLQQAAGPMMTVAAAEDVLQQARAWSPAEARRLDRHLAQHPDALTTGAPSCPVALVRLLRQLDTMGHGAAVVQIGCAVCGRKDRALPRTAPAGRCCAPCAAREGHKPCGRCGRVAKIAANRADGQICTRCYEKDPQVLEDCGTCGRRLRPAYRCDDGTALCQNCYPRPKEVCVRCGQLERVYSRTEPGPVCRRCYSSPARCCGLCGRIRPIHKRADGDQPGVCDSCHRGAIDQCNVCGRSRHGFRNRRDGLFYCKTCAPRPVRQCADCGRMRKTNAVNWPVGPLCPGCYTRRFQHPLTCSRCGTLRIAAGRTSDGHDLCGPCCGRPDLDVACRRCEFPAAIYADGICIRCTATDKAQQLLGNQTGDQTSGGTCASPLQPLIEALAAARHPKSVLDWLSRSTSARLLATLAADHATITHDLLDSLPQDHNLRHVRETLVATGVLPPRHEILARLELWLTTFASQLPSHQARYLRPFGDWHVLRGARRRAARGHYTNGAATGDRQKIRAAATFLAWLDDQRLDLASITQAHLDLWLTTNPTRSRDIRPFIRWTVARRLTDDVTLPSQPKTFGSQFLDEDDYHDQLRRCLNDGELPLDLRIIGALIRLYALQIPRITTLTTDRYHAKDGASYLTLARHPVLLPPKLATLIEQQIASPAQVSLISAPAQTGPRILLPGRPPHRPLNVESVRQRLRRHELPNITARNTAMIEAVTKLPPIVVSDLFGVAAGTAHKWAQLAQDSWTDYLAACGANE